MVLGDLDAYNGKAKPLKETLDLVKKYEDFILSLGFNPSPPSIIRSQYNALEVLRTSYIIGHYMTDKMFIESEEDLHDFYSLEGKVDSEMSYRRKLSLNLMTADFIHLHMELGFKHVLVMLGIDEHKYVRFGRETVKRMKLDDNLRRFNMTLSGIYSPMIKGFYGYPKMSKSFPDSGITVDINPETIREKIINGEGMYDKPENNVVYQMMASVSHLNAAELKENYEACLEGGEKWKRAKRDYAEMLIDICSRWKK
jgi:tryptophanyl-tRNA synthetase